MSYIKAASGNKFVVIIDEWDVLIRDEAQNHKYRKSILIFCVACLRVRTVKIYCIGVSDRNSADQEIKDTVRSQQF